MSYCWPAPRPTPRRCRGPSRTSACALAIYLAVIAAFAVGAGLLFDATLSGFVHLASGAHGHDHTAVSVLQSTGAAVFLAMLAVALFVRASRALADRKHRHDAAAESGSALDSQHDHIAPADA